MKNTERQMRKSNIPVCQYRSCQDLPGMMCKHTASITVKSCRNWGPVHSHTSWITLQVDAPIELANQLVWQICLHVACGANNYCPKQTIANCRVTSIEIKTYQKTFNHHQNGKFSLQGRCSTITKEQRLFNVSGTFNVARVVCQIFTKGCNDVYGSSL